MPALPMHTALYEMAGRIPEARGYLEALARELEGAVEDVDGVVGPDEHFKVMEALARAESALGELCRSQPIYQKDLQLVRDLHAGIDRVVPNKGKRFDAYRATVENQHAQVDHPRGTPRFRLGAKRRFVVGMTREQFERLIGTRYQLASRQGFGKHFAIDANDHVLSNTRYLDRQTGHTVRAYELYELARAAALKQGTLSIGDTAESSPLSLNAYEALVGQAGLPVESFPDLPLPEPLEAGAKVNAEGVRLVWVMAHSLAREGRLSEDQISAWQSLGRDGIDDAAHAISGLVHDLSLASSSADQRAYPDPDEIEAMLKCGVLLFTHHPDLTQAIPDQCMKRGSNPVLRAPLGPLVLAFDAASRTLLARTGLRSVSEIHYECSTPREWVVDQSFAPALSSIARLVGKSGELQFISRRVLPPVGQKLHLVAVDLADPIVTLAAPPVVSAAAAQGTPADLARTVRISDLLALWARLEQDRRGIEDNIAAIAAELKKPNLDTERRRLLEHLLTLSKEQLTDAARKADGVKSLALTAGIDPTTPARADGFLVLFARQAFTGLTTSRERLMTAADAFFHELTVHVREEAFCAGEYDRQSSYPRRIAQHMKALSFDPNATHGASDSWLLEWLKTGAFVPPRDYPKGSELERIYEEIVCASSGLANNP